MINKKLPIFEKKREVMASEIDGMNHVNNVVYVQWANEIAEQHWLEKAPTHLKEKYDWVMLKHCIEYKRAAVLGDSILVKTQVGRATNVRYERYIEIYNADTGQLLVKTTSDWCALDKTGKPVAISQELRDLFEVV